MACVGEEAALTFEDSSWRWWINHSSVGDCVDDDEKMQVGAAIVIIHELMMEFRPTSLLLGLLLLRPSAAVCHVCLSPKGRAGWRHSPKKCAVGRAPGRSAPHVLRASHAVVLHHSTSSS
jgi:hypothetical protein